MTRGEGGAKVGMGCEVAAETANGGGSLAPPPWPAGTPTLARLAGCCSHGRGKTDKMLRWLFKQVNWPGRQRDRDRWMEGDRRETRGQKNVTREERWSPGDEPDDGGKVARRGRRRRSRPQF